MLARAAVEGVVFHRSVLTALADDELPAKEGAATMALMRKGFITTAIPEIPGEDAFRFHHVLLRDAAYQALPKERRARMHVRVADWMDTVLTHHHELIGHHLREAWRYMGDPLTKLFARSSGCGLLPNSSWRPIFAVVRSALPAAARLLGQAAAMLPERSRGRVKVLVELGDVLLTSGRLQEAEQTLTEAVGVAQAIGDASGAAHASMLKLQVALQVDPDPPLAEIRAATTQAEDTFRRPDDDLGFRRRDDDVGFLRRDDDLGMCRVYHTRALGHWFAGRCEAAGNAWADAADHARAADRARSAVRDPRCRTCWRGSPRLPSSVRSRPPQRSTAACGCSRRPGISLCGRPSCGGRLAISMPCGVNSIAQGRSSRGAVSSRRDERDHPLGCPRPRIGGGASRRRRDPCRADAARHMNRLRAMGDRFMLSFSAAVLARAVEAQGRANEAYDLTFAAERLAVEGDILAHVSWRVVRARILAERGDVGEAERIAREAVELAATTDWLVGQADAAWTLGSTLFAQNRLTEADRAFEDALNLYERKEATAMVETARALRVNRYRLTSRP